MSPSVVALGCLMGRQAEMLCFARQWRLDWHMDAADIPGLTSPWQVLWLSLLPRLSLRVAAQICGRTLVWPLQSLFLILKALVA